MCCAHGTAQTATGTAWPSDDKGSEALGRRTACYGADLSASERMPPLPCSLGGALPRPTSRGLAQLRLHRVRTTRAAVRRWLGTDARARRGGSLQASASRTGSGAMDVAMARCFRDIARPSPTTYWPSGWITKTAAERNSGRPACTRALEPCPRHSRDDSGHPRWHASDANQHSPQGSPS